MKGLIYFRKDLRIYDNTALSYLEKKYLKEQIYGILILNEKQLDLNEENKNYYNPRAANFFKESVFQLKEEFTSFYKDFKYYMYKNIVKYLLF